MLKFFQDINEQKIIATDENEEVGTFSDCLFNYDNGNILAILVKTNEIFHSNEKLLLPNDILKWGQHIYIRTPEDLSLPEDIIRLRNYKKTFFSLIRIPVYTEKKKKIGNVIDYAISDLEFCLKKICVGTLGIFLLKAPSLITEINKDRIVSISSKKIIVKEPIIKEEESELATNYIPEPFC